MTRQEVVDAAAAACLRFEQWDGGEGAVYDGVTGESIIAAHATSFQDWLELAHDTIDRATELRGGAHSKSSKRRKTVTRLSEKQREAFRAELLARKSTVVDIARRYGMAPGYAYKEQRRLRRRA